MKKNLDIKFKKNTSSRHEIQKHLFECSSLFTPPLESYVNLKEYAKKIFSYAVTIEAWDRKKLVGMAAVYLNNPKTKTGFLTYIGVVKNYLRQGIATTLIDLVLQTAKKKNFQRVNLEVNKKNKKAIKLYKKYNFQIIGTAPTKNNFIVMSLSLSPKNEK